MKNCKKPIVVIGGSNIDIKGKSSTTIIKNDSNPGTIKMSCGGVGRNIAENLSRLDLPVIFLSCIGDDALGNNIKHGLNEAGIDTKHLLTTKKYSTGTYLVVLNNDGEMYVALNSMEINNLININYRFL